MMASKHLRPIGILALLSGAFFAIFLASCGGLAPEMTYQGRLTDENGVPLDGSVQITFDFYTSDTGGTSIYSETDTVMVTDGLFDTVVGPSVPVGGLTPSDLSQPLWIELTVNDGTHTESLAPRQRLYGSPYAFTLMPGAVISSTMDTSFVGGGGIEAVLTVNNMQDGDAGNPALPALRLESETGLELASPTGDDGSIYSERSVSSSDLLVFSNDEIWFHLDEDNNSPSEFRVYNGANAVACGINEIGNLFCAGTKSAVTAVNGQERLLYAIESPGVWFEDFGNSSLQNGSRIVTIDPMFAQTVNLNVDYHVFVTPLGDCNGLYVSSKTANGFEVRELGGGTSNVTFDYRLVAKRTGHESKRMELLDAAPVDREGE
jgi:hypothetical protein